MTTTKTKTKKQHQVSISFATGSRCYVALRAVPRGVFSLHKPTRRFTLVYLVRG